MNRRRLLANAVASGAVLVDYFGSVDRLDGEDPGRPSEIVATEFETGVETEASLGEEPIIAVDRETSTVTVKGLGEYGSSSCGYLTDQPPSYDPEHASLVLEVGTGREEPDDGVPARIEASHPFGAETTKTIE